MSDYDFDLFVIGAGSGGVRAARVASGYCAKVAIAEESRVGGTCVIRGCVPKKLLVYGAHFAEDFEDASAYGWTLAGEPSFSWKTLIANKDKEIERLNGIYKKLLAGSNIELFENRAVLKDAHTIAVGDKTVTADRILIAVGGTPTLPDIPGIEHAISSNEAFHLEDLPKRIAVVGGGYIAVEFAGIFAGLGAETSLIYRGDLFLRGFDQEVREFTAEEVAKKNISLRFNNNIEKIDKQADGSLLAYLTDGSILEADTIMYATGRVPNVMDLGLENVSVEQKTSGAIVVNDQFQTAEPSVYAIGDVIDRVQLTPVALAEGMALVRNLYAGKNQQVDYDLIATAVFCQPNIGTVGLSEEKSRELYENVDVYKSTFRAMKHTISGSDEKTFMKMLVDRDSDKVLGVHMVGPDAGEIIQGIAVALKAGATKAVFDSTIGIHPTAAEEFVTMREPAS